MAQPYIGEIRIFAGNYAPYGWAFCDGQTLSIAEYETLFILIGTTYGGNGEETFSLPDLRGRLPIHMGTDTLGNTYQQGENGGEEQITLNVNQIPSHSHNLVASSSIANSASPANNLPGASSQIAAYINDTANAAMRNGTLAQTGGSQPHNNMQPSLCVHFIISLYGIFPSQT